MLRKLKLSLDSQRTQQIHSRGAINHSGLFAAPNSNLNCLVPRNREIFEKPSLYTPFVQLFKVRYCTHLFLWTNMNIPIFFSYFCRPNSVKKEEVLRQRLAVNTRIGQGVSPSIFRQDDRRKLKSEQENGVPFKNEVVEGEKKI